MGVMLWVQFKVSSGAWGGGGSLLLSEEWIEAPDRPLRNHSVSWSVALAALFSPWGTVAGCWGNMDRGFYEAPPSAFRGNPELAASGGCWYFWFKIRSEEEDRQAGGIYFGGDEDNAAETWGASSHLESRWRGWVCCSWRPHNSTQAQIPIPQICVQSSTLTFPSDWESRIWNFHRKKYVLGVSSLT